MYLMSLLAAASAPATSAQIYDFKGVALGTSIEDFRRMPHPDGKTTSVVCTGEKVEKFKGYSAEPIDVMLFDGIEKQLGVKRCVWIDLAGVGEYAFGKGGTASLSLANSGYASHNYSFSFISDPKDGILRLYRYAGSTNVAAFAAIVSGLAGKWGAPTITKGTVQNKIGNSFDQETATWSNPNGLIVAQSRWSKIDDMNVVMEDKRLAKIVSDARTTKEAATPNAI